MEIFWFLQPSTTINWICECHTGSWYLFFWCPPDVTLCWVQGPRIFTFFFFQYNRKKIPKCHKVHPPVATANEVQTSGQQRAALFLAEFLTRLKAWTQPSPRAQSGKSQTNWQTQSSQSHSSDMRYNHPWHNKWEKLFHSLNVPVLLRLSPRTVSSNHSALTPTNTFPQACSWDLWALSKIKNNPLLQTCCQGQLITRLTRLEPDFK